MKHKLIVLMLGHKSLRGKDETAKALKPFGWNRVAFADKLKDTVADLYNFSNEQMYSNLKDTEDMRYPNNIDCPFIDMCPEQLPDENFAKKVPDNYKRLIINPLYKQFLTPRRVLQLFGQDQRKIYPNIWAQYVFNKIEASAEKQESCPYSLFVITDFRFQNEYSVAKNWESTENKNFEKYIISVKVNRNIKALAGEKEKSEIDLDNFDLWDYVIDNNSTLDDLKAKAEDIDFTIKKSYGLK